MTLVARILSAVAVAGYALLWTGLALVMVLAWEPPRSWIAWLVIVANPLAISIGAAFLTKRLQRSSLNV